MIVNSVSSDTGFNLLRHGDDLALSVPSDRHRRLHRREVVSDPEVHRGTLRPGVGPDRRGGLLLTPGGDRAGQKNQTTDLGHGGTGEVQVTAHLIISLFFVIKNVIMTPSRPHRSLNMWRGGGHVSHQLTLAFNHFPATITV